MHIDLKPYLDSQGKSLPEMLHPARAESLDEWLIKTIEHLEHCMVDKALTRSLLSGLPGTPPETYATMVLTLKAVEQFIEHHRLYSAQADP